MSCVQIHNDCVSVSAFFVVISKIKRQGSSKLGPTSGIVAWGRMSPWESSGQTESAWVTERVGMLTQGECARVRASLARHLQCGGSTVDSTHQCVVRGRMF